MNRFFLSIHDYLAKHKAFAVALLLVLTALCVFSALRLDYKENIADFLPTDPEKERYTSVYNDLGDQGQISLIFAADTTQYKGDEAIDAITAAMDAFELHWAECDTTPLVGNLQCRVDGRGVFDAIDFIRAHPALFLTEADYHRMDALLADSGYVAECMGNIKRTLAMPTAGFVVEGLKADPLSLYTPALQRLNALNPTQNYRMEDEYLFNESGDKGFAFFTTPFAGSDTRGNATLVDLIDKVSALTENEHPGVSVSAVGAPVIAVTNARQIKHDSYLSIALALVLIFGILLFTMARRRNLLWLGVAILFGWVFALAVIALFKTSISIIVVGVGSVIVGIAVNYPLHYLDHIKQQPDRREALKDVIQPLVIGNLTTVAAFACLVFVKAEAMRDLGLFGALTLVGTILFVMVFLPLFAVVPKKTKKLFVDDGKTPSEWWRKAKMYAFWPLVMITLALAYFGREATFDADLHNINFMTPQQKVDLALLSESMQKEGETDLVYVVAEAPDLQEALEQNEALVKQLRQNVPNSIHYSLSGLDGLLPSVERQRKSIAQWESFWQRHPDLKEQVQAEALKAGFTETAFDAFAEGIARTYEPLETTEMQPLLALCDSYVLHHDSLVRVVNFVRVPAHFPLSEGVPAGWGSHTFAFSINDVGNNLVSALSDDFDYILYVCSIVVFFFLCLSFGRLELSLLAFLPLTVGWAWILGIMNLWGIKFNIVNIILATFIFGQGDDYTIFITEGLLYEYAYGKKMLKNYRNSVILSGILMFIGIGTLVFAKHPAMRSLGEVAVVGMATVVLMACYLPPVVFGWLTKKKGQLREVPLTLLRLVRTIVSLLVFVVFVFLLFTPFTLIYIIAGPNIEKKRYRFHKLIAAFMRIALKLLPGVKFHLENRYGETFEKPAIIVANHQSHLDLLCTIMLHPKVVLLTTDWVWKNPIYGVIIRYAEYYPVSDGYEKNLERMQSLVERGYSVVVFPEGTRSETGEILRFHKGAFQLAQMLKLDLLPVFIHGANHVMPKKDIVLREGQLHVVIEKRMPYEVLAPMETRTLASQCRKYYIECFEALRKQYENTEYVLPFVRYKYIYKGPEVERACRRNLRRIKAHAAEIDTLDQKTLLVRNSGYGELAWTLALVHRDAQVYAVEADADKFLLASHCSHIPSNLHFMQSEEGLPQSEYTIETQEFLE